MLASRSKAAEPRALTISSKSDSCGVTRYLYTGRKLVSKYESNQVLLIILGLYSQQRSILKDHFEKVMSTIMADVLHRQKDGESFFSILMSQLGATLEVLEPQWLKDQLLAYVDDIVSVYK